LEGDQTAASAGATVGLRAIREHPQRRKNIYNCKVSGEKGKKNDGDHLKAKFLTMVLGSGIIIYCIVSVRMRNRDGFKTTSRELLGCWWEIKKYF